MCFFLTYKQILKYQNVIYIVAKGAQNRNGPGVVQPRNPQKLSPVLSFVGEEVG